MIKDVKDLTEANVDERQYRTWLEGAKERSDIEQYRNANLIRIGVDFKTMQPLYLTPKAFDPGTRYAHVEGFGSFIIDPSTGTRELIIIRGSAYPVAFSQFVIGLVDR